MTVVFPDGVRSRGNETVIFVTTLADPEAPTVAELTSATLAVNVSCYLSGFSPNGSQDSAEDVRLCSEQTFQDPGDVAIDIENVQYIYYPQAPPADANNKPYDLMKNGVAGYLVDRRGLNARTVAVAADQIVDVYQVRLGEQFRVPLDPGQQGGKFRISQKPFVIGPYFYDVEVAA